MSGPFGRQREKPTRKAPHMTYDGANGQEIADWSRNSDLQPRFQPERLGQPARVLLDVNGTGQGNAWIVVRVGATIHQGELEDLTVEPPAETSEETA